MYCQTQDRVRSRSGIGAERFVGPQWACWFWARPSFSQGDHFQRPDVVKVGAAWVWALFLFAPIIWFGTKESVLFVGILPSAAIWFSIGIAKLTTVWDGDYVAGVFLVMLPLWGFLIVWAPVTWVLLWLDRRVPPKRIIAKPLAELFAMTLLMAPWGLAAFILPPAIDADHETFTIMASILAGLLWGKVISEPFAKVVHVLRERGRE